MPRFQAELEQLIELKDDDDTEVAHIKADGILCSILEKLGEIEIVKAYKKVDKWYA